MASYLFPTHTLLWMRSSFTMMTCRTRPISYLYEHRPTNLCPHYTRTQDHHLRRNKSQCKLVAFLPPQSPASHRGSSRPARTTRRTSSLRIRYLRIPSNQNLLQSRRQWMAYQLPDSHSRDGKNQPHSPATALGNITIARFGIRSSQPKAPTPKPSPLRDPQTPAYQLHHNHPSTGKRKSASYPPVHSLPAPVPADHPIQSPPSPPAESIERLSHYQPLGELFIICRCGVL
jgi:hypothetical protein